LLKDLENRNILLIFVKTNKAMAQKLKDGQTVTINIPFTYTIGDEGFHSGKVLKTVEDCKDEVLAEIQAGVLDEGEVFLEVGAIE
jgi:hypothetical protein